MNNTPKITLEELALMVKKGFDENSHQFRELRQEMDERFDAVDKRFDILEVKVDRLEVKMDNVESAVFKDHSTRIKRLERKLEIA